LYLREIKKRTKNYHSLLREKFSIFIFGCIGISYTRGIFSREQEITEKDTVNNDM